MANNENLIPINKRTKSEQREIRSAGGKASGASRRKTANFRKIMNTLLTAEINDQEWAPILNAMGVDSTFESAVNMAMIKEALEGNVKAYIAIRDTLGQTTKSRDDLKEQKLRMKQIESTIRAADQQAADDEPVTFQIMPASGRPEGEDDAD